MLLGGYEVKKCHFRFFSLLCGVLLHFFFVFSPLLHSRRRRFADVFLTRMHLRREANIALLAVKTSTMPARVCVFPENGNA